MWDKIKAVWSMWATEGIKFPFIYDAASKNPSITLSFAYVSFIMVCISLTVMHFTSTVWDATALTLLFWVMSVVFYRLRRLDSFKMNLKDKTVELSGSEEDKEDPQV